MTKLNNTTETLEKTDHRLKQSPVALPIVALVLAAPTRVSSHTTITSPISDELTMDITTSNAEACIDIHASEVVFGAKGHTIVVTVQALIADRNRAVVQAKEATVDCNDDADQQADPKADVVDIQALFVEGRAI